MQTPTINVYGPFQALDSNGNRVDLASTKARHIFTALVLAYPQPIQRETLCKTIWPESSDESRKVRLRQELGILREFVARLGYDEMLVADKGYLAIKVEGIFIDCIESRRLYDAYASTLLLDDRLQNLTAQIELLGRGQIAADAQSLFDVERKRTDSRLTTARIELTKIYIEVGSFPEARKVLDAVLDLHPDNEAAKTLHARLLETGVQLPKEDRPEPPQPPMQRKPSPARWLIPIATAAVVAAAIILFVIPPTIVLVKPAPQTRVTTPPISQIIAYQHTPGPGEFDDSEFIGVTRNPDGLVAVAGIVKTKTEDVDGLVTLLGSDLKPLWTRRVSSSSHDADRLESIRFDAAKNVFAAGETYSITKTKSAEGWYGSVVSYDVKGKLRFQATTRRKIIHGSEVKRRVVADERGGAWFCSSTAENGKEQIFATHFDSTGRIINDIVISGVHAKVINFSRHTQDEYCVIGNAKSTPSSAANDWFMASFTNDGRILWTSKIDGPANADDFITSESLSREAEYHYVTGLMTSSKSPNDVPQLVPTLATINVHTGAVGRQISLISDIPNPYVTLNDLSKKGELQLAVHESTIDSRQPISLNILDSVTGAIKSSEKVTLPDGQYLTHVRRFVSNPKNGTLQLVTNTARDIGTNASQGIVVSTIKSSGELTHEIYKNVDRVTLNMVEQRIGVGQVDMGGRWAGTVFNLPYPD
jgi:DNA-binding SARP family transcriptional activator